MKNRMLTAVFTVLIAVLISIGATGAVTAAEDLDTSDLIYAISLAPDRSDWDDYIDTTVLQSNLEWADSILSSAASNSVTQETIDFCTKKLLDSISGLKPHSTGVEISQSTKWLAVGNKSRLYAAVTPENAGDPIVWSSSNSSVVSVDSTGLIEALKYSSSPVKITAASNGHKASCTVSLINPLAGVKFITSTASVYETKRVQLSVMAYGKDATYSTTDSIAWTWKSSDTSVARVSSTGLVTGISSGSCTITATATNGTASYSASGKVYVNDFISVKTLQPITVSATSGLSVTVGESATYRLGILPTNASNQKVNWVSSNPKVAAVTSTGTTNSIAGAAITGVSAGTATISYMAADGSGVSGSVKITVSPLISSVSLGETNLVLLVGSSQQLKPKILPSNAGNQILTWSSSDSSVCSVDYKGNLTAKKLGICTIYAKTSDGTALTVSCNVRVASKASSVTLSKATLAMNSSGTYRLYATVQTVDGTTYTSCNEVSWSSSDTSVATVSSWGNVCAGKPGRAIILAKAKDGSGIAAGCIVTVTAPVKGVSLPETLTLGIEKTKTLSPVFNPTYASNKNVTWSSSNSAVATVSSSGLVTAKKVGTAVITCVTADGGHKASCKVSVVIPTSGVSLNKTSIKLDTGSKMTLTATVYPANASDKSVKWKSSNTAIATVSSGGTVTSVAPGTATITATTADGGYTAKCTVTSVRRVTGITMSSRLNCYTGQAVTLKASVKPADATNKGVTYTSSNTSIVAVGSSTGVLTLKKSGSATITAKTSDGGYIAKCTVVVNGKISVTGFKFAVTSTTLKVGEAINVQPTITPSDASEQGINWTTSNSSVVWVYKNGGIVAKGPGTAVVTGTTVDGGFVASCKVTVTQPVSGVSFSSSSYTVNAGKTVALATVIKPANASNKKLYWFCTDTSVATVSGGVVKGIKAGTATVRCKTADGGYVASCTINVNQPVTGVKLSSSSITVNRGDKVLLTATVLPANASNKAVVWSTTNRFVASVTSTGKVSTLLTGTAIISVTTSDGLYKASCTINVVQPVTDLELSSTELKIDVGKSKTLTATITPSNATNTGVTWNSLDPSVATVSSSGKVTAIAAGTTKIVASSKDGYCSDYCTVTVRQPPTSVTISPSVKKLNVGCKSTLTAKVMPASAYDKTVTWRSSDTSVATINSSGLVTALKAGTVTITCTTNAGGCTATSTLIAKIPPTSVSLNKSSMTLLAGKTSTLKATVLPATATYKNVSWSSSNPKVATVSSSGTVKAIAIGSATITATTTDGAKTATCFVTVPNPVTGITLDTTSAKLEVGSALQLNVKISPVDATYDDIRWSTSDSSVAIVTKTGIIKALTPGTAVITATTVDGGYKASCKVTVFRSVIGVSLDYTTRSLKVGNGFYLKASVAPSSATNQKVTWSSSNLYVASVTQTGFVTANHPGTAVITVKTQDGGYTEICKITVT